MTRGVQKLLFSEDLEIQSFINLKDTNNVKKMKIENFKYVIKCWRTLSPKIKQKKKSSGAFSQLIKNKRYRIQSTFQHLSVLLQGSPFRQ